MPVYCQPSRKPVGIRRAERTQNLKLVDYTTKQSRNMLQLLRIAASAFMQVKHGCGQRKKLLELVLVNGVTQFGAHASSGSKAVSGKLEMPLP